MFLFAVLATMLPIRPGFRQLARRVMEHRVEQKAHTGTVAIDASTIKPDAWEDDHEFRKDGKLYDVVSASNVEGKKYYQCYADELEVSAEKEADNLVRELVAPKPASPQGKVARALADWLSQLYHAPAPTLQLHYHSLAKAEYLPAFVAGLPKPHLQRFAPPPEA
jgi:hypothetical protein